MEPNDRDLRRAIDDLEEDEEERDLVREWVQMLEGGVEADEVDF